MVWKIRLATWARELIINAGGKSRFPVNFQYNTAVTSPFFFVCRGAN